MIDEYRKDAKEIGERVLTEKGLRPEYINSQTKFIELNRTFFPLCQIQVIEIQNRKDIHLFVTFDEDRPDKEIIVTKIPKDVEPSTFLDRHSNEWPQLLKQLRYKDLKLDDVPEKSTRLYAIKLYMTKTRERGAHLSWTWIDGRAILYYFPDTANLTAKLLKSSLWDYENELHRKIENFQKIDDAEKVVDEFKRNVE